MCREVQGLVLLAEELCPHHRDRLADGATREPSTRTLTTPPRRDTWWPVSSLRPSSRPRRGPGSSVPSRRPGLRRRRPAGRRSGRRNRTPVAPGLVDDHAANRERRQPAGCRDGGSRTARSWSSSTRVEAVAARGTTGPLMAEARESSSPGSSIRHSAARPGNPARSNRRRRIAVRRPLRFWKSAGFSPRASPPPTGRGRCERRVAAEVDLHHRGEPAASCKPRRLEGRANAVSERFISAATSCIQRSGAGPSSRQTAAGLPAKQWLVNE